MGFLTEFFYNLNTRKSTIKRHHYTTQKSLGRNLNEYANDVLSGNLYLHAGHVLTGKMASSAVKEGVAEAFAAWCTSLDE